MGTERVNQSGGLRLTDGRVFREARRVGILERDKISESKLRAAEREQWVVGWRHG